MPAKLQQDVSMVSSPCNLHTPVGETGSITTFLGDKGIGAGRATLPYLQKSTCEGHVQVSTAEHYLGLFCLLAGSAPRGTETMTASFTAPLEEAYAK